MKTTKIKTFIVLACMMMGVTSIARGQVYSNGYYYYHSETSDKMLVIKFDGSKAIYRHNSGEVPNSEKYIRGTLKSNPNFYEIDFTGTYTGGLSQDIYEYYTTKGDYTIYCHIWKEWNGATLTMFGPQPTFTEKKIYIAVSSDKQTVLYWHEGSERKSKFIKVDKSHYLPKDDFFDE